MSDPKNFKSIKWGFPILFNKNKDKENIMKILNKNSIFVDLAFIV